MKKVAVLMSGGVDSSVAAYILSKKFDVFGVTLKLWECNLLNEYSKQLCCSPQEIYDAKNVCVQIGIKHYVIDLSKEFNELIVKKFCEKYISGFTPNPCVWCNEKIKFGVLFERLKELMEIDYIASGHYAKVVNKNDNFYIAKARDESKDQSYFLSRVSPKVLPYVIFPLGEYLKSEVRNIAKQLNLKVADKKESFDLCFVSDNNYRNFIKQKNLQPYRGKIIEYSTGKFLGYHQGYFNYTIGQRKGLGLKNLKSRYYVVDIDAKNNIVYVGPEKNLYSKTLIAGDCVFYEKLENMKNKALYAKIRYKSELSECELENIGDVIKITFKIPQRAITKGQYVVVYDEEYKVLLSAEILNSKNS